MCPPPLSCGAMACGANGHTQMANAVLDHCAGAATYRPWLRPPAVLGSKAKGNRYKARHASKARCGGSAVRPLCLVHPISRKRSLAPAPRAPLTAHCGRRVSPLSVRMPQWRHSPHSHPHILSLSCSQILVEAQSFSEALTSEADVKSPPCDQQSVVLYGTCEVNGMEMPIACDCDAHGGERERAVGEPRHAGSLRLRHQH